jgi:ABC-type nitrate/sulfonate/bicarbonate transport system ATPase subunit
VTSSPESPAKNAVIQITTLTVTKGDHAICRAPGINVLRGERIGIVGPNGSGKSTLLRVLAGFETDFAGDCRVTPPQKETVFVHQSPFLFRGTVLSNVEYGLAARFLSRSDRRTLALDWLKRFGIAELANRQVNGLSGGEARRTALTRACVLTPQLLLLDEPLAELDPAGIDCVQQALTTLSASTILIASPTALPTGFVEKSVELSNE